MSKHQGFLYKNEPAGCAIECKLTKPGLNPSSISFYYGKSSYLAIAISSRNDMSYDA